MSGGLSPCLLELVSKDALNRHCWYLTIGPNFQQPDTLQQEASELASGVTEMLEFLKSEAFIKVWSRTSLAIQWLRIYLSMQGTRG